MKLVLHVAAAILCPVSLHPLHFLNMSSNSSFHVG